MKKLPNWELLCYSYIAFLPWNHLERAKHHWNYLERRRAIGTCEAPLERPQGNWNHLERAKHHWNARRAIGTIRNVRSTIGTARSA